MKHRLFTLLGAMSLPALALALMAAAAEPLLVFIEELRKAAQNST